MPIKGTKILLSAVISAELFLSAAPVGAFAEGSGYTLTELNLSFAPPVCGQHFDPAVDSADLSVADGDDEIGTLEVFAGKPVWVTAYDSAEPFSYTAFEGDFAGGQKYTAFFELRPAEGYSFGESVTVSLCNTDTWEDSECSPLLVEPGRVVIAYECEAVHDWDEDRTERTDPDCKNAGSETKYCRADETHVVTNVLPADSSAHRWGEWETVTASDPLHEGEKKRTCGLCGTEETAVIPKYVMPFTKVYEPETSWAMSATVAWRADETAVQTAGGSVRPATCFVWLDKELNVYDRNGKLISGDLDEYVRSTAPAMIPAFYISDEETAAALKSRIQSLGLADCFVVSTPENKALVKDVADLLYVRGMLDFSEKKSLTRKDIADMIADVNGAHGKTVILSEEAATKENVKLLQSLTATVWIRTEDSTESIMRAYTRGANGIVTDDHKAAIKWQEFFADDAPTLLRIPLIIGHRGDPSVYVENTLDSAKGAFAEGADSVENDILLSKDGELFILHDDHLTRLIGLEDVPSESLTLDELRSHPFVWERIIDENEVPAERTRDGKLYGQDERKEYTVPTLREYIETFRGTGLVHDTEIKSFDPAIIPVYKALVDEYDAWDQFFNISFNEAILDTLYRDYPEISIGCLLIPIDGRLLDYMPEFADYQRIEDESGAEEALKVLYSALDKWNATYDPTFFNFGEKMINVGRHRGLTTWMWTYTENTFFTRDFLRGIEGMTTDEAWKTSHLLVGISSEDVTAESEDDIPKPSAVTQSDEIRTLDDAELVKIEELGGSSTLMIWRYKADLNLGGESCGNYYLYSEPFVFTQKTAAADNADAAAEKSSGHSSGTGTAGGSSGTASTGDPGNGSAPGTTGTAPADTAAPDAAPSGDTPSEGGDTSAPAGTSEGTADDAPPETGTVPALSFGALLLCAFIRAFGRAKGSGTGE